MAENSNIQWTDHTFNPWIGCTKVSPGCTNCYAAAQDKFRSWTPEGWGAGKPRKRSAIANWKKPLKWNVTKQGEPIVICDCCGNQYAGAASCLHTQNVHRPRVFCASLADWLDDEVPIEWLADLLKLIHETPNLDWLLLTKRPENWRSRIIAAAEISAPPMLGRLAAWLVGAPRPNVWIGTTAEEQKRADERIPHLLQIPAKVRFLSCEPLLERVDLTFTCFNGADSFGTMPGIHWVICGGESGSGARPMQIEWAQSLANQCKAANVAFFMKQLGGIGKHRGELTDFPESLRIREFPLC